MCGSQSKMLGIPVYLQIRLNSQQRTVTNMDVFENSIINHCQHMNI